MAFPNINTALESGGWAHIHGAVRGPERGVLTSHRQETNDADRILEW
jgi:hypothetical protein